MKQALACNAFTKHTSQQNHGRRVRHAGVGAALQKSNFNYGRADSLNVNPIPCALVVLKDCKVCGSVGSHSYVVARDHRRNIHRK